MSEEIARVYFGKGKSSLVCGKAQFVQPSVYFEPSGCGDYTDLVLCENGVSDQRIGINLEMFDALRELVSDPRVIEHYSRLRQPKYELSCGGDPVPSYKPRTLRNNQLNKEHKL